ncbi:hypothetical protein PBI_GRAYSON_221 [Rhodococcus phage Grayson]|nr:hypothetical protein PBI_GRAYSON_221 [Rhodococcus phage Grayson]
MTYIVIAMSIISFAAVVGMIALADYYKSHKEYFVGAAIIWFVVGVFSFVGIFWSIDNNEKKECHEVGGMIVNSKCVGVSLQPKDHQ